MRLQGRGQRLLLLLASGTLKKEEIKKGKRMRMKRMLSGMGTLQRVRRVQVADVAVRMGSGMSRLWHCWTHSRVSCQQGQDCVGGVVALRCPQPRKQGMQPL